MPHSKITLDEIQQKQSAWAAGIIHMGQLWLQKEDCHHAACCHVEEHYAYGYEAGVVQFKPTWAREKPFRQTAASAVSYFVGGDTRFPEDTGFALMLWQKIAFNNMSYYHHCGVATVMGLCEFVDVNGQSTVVEYTMGYVRTGKGEIKLFLHHSSLPFCDV